MQMVKKKKKRIITEHEKLQNAISNILKNCAFEKVDLEVEVDTDFDNNIELSIDVCAIDQKTLFVFQCKDVKEIPHIKDELSSTKHYFKRILAKKFEVKQSSKKIITTSDLKKIKEIKCCYAFTKKLAKKNTEHEIIKSGFNFWNHRTVRYFSRVSAILKHLTKNEIFREFKIKFPTKKLFEEPAVSIQQGDNPPMYLLGMHPGLLLKIAYVYRRSGTQPDAYQRLINRDRLDSISMYFKETPNLMLPNCVIIVFDKDRQIRSKIRYLKGKKVLRFPVSYCSACIIDGQHRIYGFKDHPDYKKWTGDDSFEEEFKIPVVAFKALPEIDQNKTFVNINYYQKKIDAVLFNDLATVIKDLKQDITWPSLLVAELNKSGPWKDMIKISELDESKSITISGFAKTKLKTVLLGFKKTKKERGYNGILFRIAEFDENKPFEAEQNQKAFSKQVELLNRFFRAVRKNVHNKDKKKDKWKNSSDYSLTRFTSVNALLLVLNALLEKDEKLSMDLEKLLSVINKIDLTPKGILDFGRPGYPAMPHIANKIIELINDKFNAGLKPVLTSKR